MPWVWLEGSITLRRNPLRHSHVKTLVPAGGDKDHNLASSEYKSFHPSSFSLSLNNNSVACYCFMQADHS